MMNKPPFTTGIVSPSVTGGKRFYICLACKHRFMLALPTGLFCPECKSLRVVADPLVRY